MDFYERKAKAIGIMDKMIAADSFTREDIILAVLKNTMLGKKFVEDYINSVVFNGLCLINKDTGIIGAPKKKA